MSNPLRSTYVNCPTCDSKVQWHPDSVSRPFCSERCRLIDLGDWIEENNKISTPIEEGFPS
ncbi:MAG: DNA gyrase inhibitor YacG [Candidatus Polarisedimenticolaceae bacterium]|nr:DNA gyrase inhibitor YacG [Candidatus Polarisedimenticolaceae bacterium]